MSRLPDGRRRGLGRVVRHEGQVRETTAYGRRIVLAALTLHAWGCPAILWPPDAESVKDADREWLTQVLVLRLELSIRARDRTEDADEAVA